MIRRTAAVALLAMLALPAAGCGGGSAVSDLGTVVEGAKGKTVQVELGTGRRFSLAVADNPSAGDAWTLETVPDTKVASFISHEKRPAGEGARAGGTSYFVFNTKHPGTTEIKLFDCWRCDGKTPSTDESRQQSGEAIFALTVR